MVENVLELLDKHGIHYEDKGDEVMCLCLNPNHDDKRLGSFYINKKKKFAYCFSCGFKANIYKLNKILGEDIQDAKFRTYKFTKSLRPVDKAQDKKKRVKKITYPKPVIIGKLLEPFDNPDIMSFLNKIGIYDRKFIEDYGIKYTEYSEMIADDLYGNPDVDYTKMRERICIPIHHNGKLINIECRTYTGGTPKVKYIKGCSMQTLFNYENIDRTKPVVLTESIKNLCKIWNVYPNVIAMFHAIPSENQLRMLNKINSIIFFADNDAGSFGELKDGKLKEGGIQVLAQKYKGRLLVCWDKRTYWKDDKEKNERVLKGYDANDCTLDEIKAHINGAVSYEELKASGKVLTADNS